ncbi:MAG: hypothetical protein PHH54_04990 [Candidatus Nanoarchaeia archaeon]|nr:hypothetical protein [Candidatus Nanoarchaeia archaeon]MDD5741314.1 hypothetical protein [Candidatus Nanoarchaeia archaeon]
MDKKFVLIGLLMTLMLIGSVLAITASIGNARMILDDAKTGDTIERSIAVKNTNDVAVKIKLFATGDLAEDIKIKDDNFTLNAGEEKKAFFTIKVKKAGETESKINVQFTPVDGKNGAGLSSTIIVVASGEDVNDGEDTNADTNTGNSNDHTNSSSTGITGNVIGKLDKNMIALGTTLIVALVFIVVLIIYYRPKKKIKNGDEKIEKEKVVKTKLKKKVKKRV